MTKKTVYNPRFIQSFLCLKADKVHSSFGGSSPYGGLNKKAFDKINEICRIPGMGASEFEGRYFPDALETLQEYVTKGTLSIKTITVGRDGYPKKDLIILAHDEAIANVAEVLTNWVNEPSWEEYSKSKSKKRKKPQVSTKGHDLFRVSIESKKLDEKQLPVGWICEDHEPYMFFVKEEMAADFIKLLYTNLKFHKKDK